MCTFYNCPPSRRAAQISDAFREHVDVGALSVRSKPLTDAEELLPLCYRCSSQNPLLGGNSCTVCKHPLITSTHSREFLPLVEFAPEEGLGPAVVSRLIENDTTHGAKRKASGDAGDAQVMSLEDGDDDEDPFLSQLSEYEAGRDVYEPIVATREMLKAMPSTSVFRQGSLDGGDPRFFYNILPEMGVSMCHTCNRVRGVGSHGIVRYPFALIVIHHPSLVTWLSPPQFFTSENWELLTLKSGQCSFCRTSPSVCAL